METVVSQVNVITDAEFDQEVSAGDQIVLVYFWATWCGPCRLVSPSIEGIAKAYGDRLKVLKLEVDPNPESRSKCKVEGVPALRIFKENQIVASHEGAIGKQGIEEMIKQHLN